jgi:hypothetical protein
MRSPAIDELDFDGRDAGWTLPKTPERLAMGVSC